MPPPHEARWVVQLLRHTNTGGIEADGKGQDRAMMLHRAILHRAMMLHVNRPILQHHGVAVCCIMTRALYGRHQEVVWVSRQQDVTCVLRHQEVQ